MRGILSLFSLVLLLCYHVRADGNQFFNPPQATANYKDWSNNQVYKLGQTIQLRWTTTFNSSELVLFKAGQPKGSEPERILTIPNDKDSYEWIARPQRGIDNGHTFWFQIHNSSDHNMYFQSARVNITHDGTSTTSGSSKATHTSTFTGTSTSTSTFSADSANNNKNNNSGLSDKAKVGVGVGVGLGCAFIIALAGILWFFRRRFAAVATNVPPGIEAVTGGGGAEVAGPMVVPVGQVPYKPEYYPQDVQQPVAEVPGDRGVELPANYRVFRHELPA